MLMRRMLPNRALLKTLLKYESTSLFISCGDVLVFISEDSAALSSQDANDVLPSAGISHRSVYKPPLPVIIPSRQQ